MPCVATVGSAVVHYDRAAPPKNFWWIAGLPGLLALAVIFNPVEPIYLHNKGVWGLIDLSGLVVFGVAAVHLPTAAQARMRQPTEIATGSFLTLSGWILGAALMLGLAVAAFTEGGPSGNSDCNSSCEPGC